MEFVQTFLRSTDFFISITIVYIRLKNPYRCLQNAIIYSMCIIRQHITYRRLLCCRVSISNYRKDQRYCKKGLRLLTLLASQFGRTEAKADEDKAEAMAQSLHLLKAFWQVIIDTGDFSIVVVGATYFSQRTQVDELFILKISTYNHVLHALATFTSHLSRSEQ